MLAAQAAAFPPQVEEAYDDEEPFDVETESEVETEETEGLTDDAAEAAARRKRRQTATAASGADAGAAVASRVTAPPRARTVTPMRVAGEAVEGAAAEDGEADEDEGDEQPGVARGDQPANGERRPRRRGRRGGRRRRGTELEDGLAGSIADELGPTLGFRSDQRGCRFRRRRVRARAIAGAEPDVRARTGLAAGGDAACGLRPARAGRERARAVS